MVDQLVKTKLWEHQQTEITRLEPQPRVLIAWQMGAGKTLGAIERDLRIRHKLDAMATMRTLIVAPLSTHGQWAAAIRKECPGASVREIDSKKRNVFLESKVSGGAHFYIMHYEALRLMPELRGYFRHGIFDECHRLKNRKTAQTRAAKKLKIPYLTDMSGSPVTDRPADFWSTLNHLWPKAFRGFTDFCENYVEYEITYPGPYKKAIGPKVAWKEVGLPAIHKGYSRVLKADVMDLPPKVYETILVDLSPTQRKLYNQMRDEMIAWVKNQSNELEPLVATAAIAKMTRLQQFALGTMTYDEHKDVYRMKLPSAKIERMLEEVKEHDTEQFVFFSQFKAPLILAQYQLKQLGIDSIKYTGDEDKKTRERGRVSFSQGSAQVFLSTIRAGGEGVDGLQNHCYNMGFFDRDWSPMRNEQAEDRLHRGGQEAPVLITDYMARNTIDFSKAITVEKKRSWVLQMLGDM